MYRTSRLARSLRVAALVILALSLPCALGAQSLYRVIEAPDPGAPETELRLQVDTALLRTLPERLVLRLPGGPVEAVRLDAERRAEGVLWRGSLGAAADPELPRGDATAPISVVLTLHRDILLGRIFSAEGHFAVQPSDIDGAHRLSRIERLAGVVRRSAGAAALPAPCAGPAGIDREVPTGAARLAAAAGDLQSPGAQNGTPRLDVMIAYTPRAQAELGGGRLQAEAVAAVDYLNTSLANSGVSGRGRLVETVIAPQLDHLRSQADGLPTLRVDPTVLAQRDAARADVVVLFMASSDSADGCGLGYVMLRGDTPVTMAPYAFSTVNVGCDIGSTTAHEIGHNLGLNHDPQNANVADHRKYAPDAHGHFYGLTSNFKTVMSYGPFNDIPYFSTPDIIVRGQPIGILDERNNTRVLGETLRMGSRFHDGNSPPTPSGNPEIAPTDLSASEVSPSAVTLSWLDNAPDEISVLIERRASGEAWQQILQLPPDSVSTRVEGLIPATSYDFRARVRTASEYSTYSNRVTVMTLSGPGRPEAIEATPFSATAILVTYSGIAAGDTVRVERRGLDSLPGEWDLALEAVEDGNGSVLIPGLEPGEPSTFRVLAVGANGEPSEPSEPLHATTRWADGECVADGQTLCLLGGRFELRAHWNDPFNPPLSGAAGTTTVPGSDETGLFYFFDAANVELVSKMLDGTGLTDSYWHFYGALSNVEYWVTVRDTSPGAQKTYHNEPYDLCGAADLEAFFDPPTGAARRTAPSSTAASPPPQHTVSASGACVQDDERLCLRDGRFEVTVQWTSATGSGVGRPVAGTATNDSGFLWFFTPSNLELAVKILDGRPINGKFWFYWGGLSDVAYTIQVRDTVSGQTASYASEAGSVCGGADVEAIDG